MAERRIGANWSLLPTPPLPPPAPVELSRLAAVSCPTLALCRAVGFADASVPAIAERYDGTNWQLEPIPLSAPYVPSMADVSCPSRFFCMAVGGWSFRSAAGTLSAKWTP
jgi:hypothetical protein